MSVPVILNEYLSHLETRNYSPNTICRLRTVVGAFARFCDPLAATELLELASAPAAITPDGNQGSGATVAATAESTVWAQRLAIFLSSMS